MMRSLLVAALAVLAAGPLAAQTHTVTSPDGRTVVTVTSGDALSYTVDYDRQPLVLPSPLGVVLGDGDTLGVRIQVVDAATVAHDDTWTQPWGEVETVRDHHNQLTVELAETGARARRMDLVVRVFDNGVGIRYEWPEQPGLGAFTVMDELTGFRFARDGDAWWIRAYEWDRYELLYTKSRVPQAGSALNTPATFAFDGGPYVAVHEAALTDFAAMSLRRTGPLAFKADLAPWSTGVKVYTAAPARTPWRVLMIGDTAGDLVTNYTVLNLNEPNALGDVSWVHPAKYVGIWWAMHLDEWTWEAGPRHGATTEHARDYIDFAAEHGFDGVLVEGWNLGWEKWLADGRQFSFTEPYPDYDFAALADYARQRGTHIVGHHETGGNAPHYEEQLDAAFALMAERDVQAVKTGYVDYGAHFPRVSGVGVAPGDTAREWNTGQYMVGHYLRTVQAAARHRVSINIHESIKDTGLRRTYPNLLSREAARGQEYNAPWGGGNGPDHIPTMVFTRLLTAPMDFTPGIFDLDDSTNFVPTTLAGQLALYVVIYSPVQMAADLPENYTPHMDAFQFIKDVPVDWAETRVLEAQIGDFVTTVRRDRQSDDWYLGAKTDGSARTMDVALDFLTPGRRYTATLYRDADDADWQTNAVAYEIETRAVTSADRMTVPLAPGGGLAVRFAAD